MVDHRRRPSGSVSARKTEAWALAIGVSVPLAHPYDEVRRVRRGSLPDVLPEPNPQRPQRAGALAGLGALARRLLGRAEAQPAGRTPAVATLRQPEPAAAEPDTAAGTSDTPRLAA